jgi:hypothetical protein
MYPGRGKVLASGRRLPEPFIEFVYTMMIYALLTVIGFFAWFVYREISLEKAEYQTQSIKRAPR